MSAVLQAQEQSARYKEAVEPTLLRQFELLAGASSGVARVRELILSLAVSGQLVAQDPNDEPVHLEAVAAQVLRLIDEGTIPKSRANEVLEDRRDESELPIGWAAVRGSDVFIPRSGNSKLIKGKLFSEPSQGLYAGYSASGQDVWLSSFEYEGTAVILSAVGARCGKAFLARGKWSAIANTHIIWPIEGTVTAEYAMLLLNDEDFWIKSGGAQPFLKVTETLQRTVLIPPLKEQARIVARVDELMRLCDALEAKGRLEAEHHAQLLSTLLGTLTDSSSAEELAANWQRVAAHFDLLLDRPEAVDALEQTILQLAVRGLLVSQSSSEESAKALLQRIRAERSQLAMDCKIKQPKSLESIADDEKPFELPPGWEWVRLGDIQIFTNGFAFKSEVFSEAGVGVVRIGNVQGGEITENKMVYLPTSLADEIDHQFFIEPGDLVITMTGDVKLGFNRSSRRYLLNQRVGKIQPLLVDPVYLAIYLALVAEQKISEASGSVIPNVSTGEINSTVIPLPPLPEQTRIVARVDQLRSLCADLRQRFSESKTTQCRLAEALVESATA